MIFGEGPIIKNIAGDLNKLFLQGTRAGQPINNVEGDAAADQATIQLMADRDPVIRDISTGLGWAGREVTVSGTGALQLVNSLGRPLKSWSVELAPYQEGSGDPSPENVRRIYGTNKITLWTSGVNLLNIAPQSGSVLGIDYSVDNDGYVTLNGMNSTGTNIYLATHIPPMPMQITLSSDTRIANGIYTGLVQQNGSTGLLELRPSETQKTSSESGILEESRYRIYIAENSSFNNFRFRIMLNVGAAALPYQPYAGLNKTEITLPQTVYSGTVSSGGGEKRTALKRITAFTGAWGATANGFAVYASVWDGIRTGVQMCDKFAFSTSGYTDMPVYSWYGGSGTNSTFTFVLPSTITSLSEANQWIADNGGYIEFTHNTVDTDTFPLTAPTIPTAKGTATAWATAEDGIVNSMSVTYVERE